MPKYTFTLNRSKYVVERCTVTVEAMTQEDAEEKAIEYADSTLDAIWRPEDYDEYPAWSTPDVVDWEEESE